MKSLSIFPFSLLVLILLPAIALGQATLKGVVTDASNNEPLIGVNVVIQGTSLGAATDIEGGYRITGIPEQRWPVKISCIGYEPLVRELDFSTSASLELSLQLTPMILQGEEVVVTAQMRGQVAAINQQLTSEAMINAVSAEKIKQIPDVNAAEAIGRLPGISVTRNAGEGSGVVIRGLDPKYSKITINGTTIPSTSDVTRATDLSMIAPDNLGGIEVFKAITPDMEADAISGTVNLTLMKARPEAVRSTQVYGAYNNQEDDWGQYKGSFRWNERFVDDWLGIQASVNIEKMNRSSDRLNATYTPGIPRGDTIPLLIQTANIMDRQEVRKRWGSSLILDFNVDDNQFLISNYFGYSSRAALDRYHDYDNSRGDTRASSVQFGVNTSLMTNALKYERTLFGLETSINLTHAYSKTETPYRYRMTFAERTSISIPQNADREASPMEFLKNLGKDSAATLYEAQIQNGTTTERNWGADANFKIPFSLTSDISGYMKFGGKYKAVRRSNDRTEGLFPPRAYRDVADISVLGFLDPSYSPGNVLNGSTELGLVLNPTLNEGFYRQWVDRYSIDNFWGNNDRYQVTERISAGYMMLRLNVGQFLTVIPGIRRENVNNDYTGYVRIATSAWPDHVGTYQDTTTTVGYGNWFPMIHVKFKPADWLDLRFAVTRTLSRPDFWDLVPYLSTGTDASVDPRKGNPGLKPAISLNYDVYTSLYSNTLGLLTVGAFYKSIDNITIHLSRYLATQDLMDQYGIPARISIDTATRVKTISGTPGSRTLIIPVNAPQSTIKGFEVDLQTNLGHAMFLPPILRGFVFNLNYSRIYSKTGLPYYRSDQVVDTMFIIVGGRKIPRQVTGYVYTDSIRTGPTPNQSDHILNFSVGYDLGGFSARLSMHYQTGSLATVGTQEISDTYTDAFTRYDIALRQRLSENFNLFFDVVNVTNNPDQTYQYRSAKPTKIEYYGRMYSFGVQCEF